MPHLNGLNNGPAVAYKIKMCVAECSICERVWMLSVRRCDFGRVGTRWIGCRQIAGVWGCAGLAAVRLLACGDALDWLSHRVGFPLTFQRTSQRPLLVSQEHVTIASVRVTACEQRNEVLPFTEGHCLETYLV